MKNKIVSTLFILLFGLIVNSSSMYGQQKVEILARLDTITQTFQITQKIQFKNQSDTTLEKLILNDWNHSYSNRKTNLGKRFSDQYVRNFHLSTERERGQTTNVSIVTSQTNTTWNRLNNQIDLIQLNFAPLKPNDSITINLAYTLKLPDAKFTRWGNEKGNYYWKDFFILISKNMTTSLQYSNENIEDAVLEDVESMKVLFQVPSNYTITSNLNETSKHHFEGIKTKEIQFAIEKKLSFENYKNDKVEVATNLHSYKVEDFQKAIIIDKIINYIDFNLGKSKATKIMVSQIDYERNPFYGLNQLPAFLSPFSNSFLYELKFLKVYTHNYLKQNLNIDFRKEHFLIDGIESYILMNYIEENYPDLTLIGNLSSYKLTKNYQLSKARFNDQYPLLYLLMARKNLDQSLGESKENLLKFNEQIASRYKSGLAFKFLESYLNLDDVKSSIQKFMQQNTLGFSTQNDFKNILVASSSKNIDWFFDELIAQNHSIDYSFGKLTTDNNTRTIAINNKTKSEVPFKISGYKKNTKQFDYWVSEPKKDTVFLIPDASVEKLIINDHNFFTELNQRNNFKSLKNGLSFNRPLKLTFIRDIENPSYQQLFYMPELGFNVYDGAMLTMSFHNKTLIEKPFTFDFSPSYSTIPQKLTGSFGFSYRYYRKDKNLYAIQYSFGSSYFHYYYDAGYTKITPTIGFYFRDTNLKSNKGQNITFRQTIVNKERALTSVNDKVPLQFTVLSISYSNGDSETAKGFGYSVNPSFTNEYGKITSEIGYRKLFENNYQFSLRLFLGHFLYNKQDNLYAFGLDKPQDMLFDYNFYGRSEATGLFSQQLVIAEGGFKSKLKNPYANQWMTTLNATSSIWKWIELYGDIGYYKNATTQPKFVFDSGLHLNLVPGYFELFFPVYSSKGFEPSQNNYEQKIRFVVTLNPNTLIKLFTRKWF